MNLVIKLLLFLCVLGFAGLFVLKKPDGSPWLVVDDFMPSVASIKAIFNNAVPDEIVDGSGDVAVYRWKDAEGNWQYADHAPTQGAEQVMVSTDLNKDLVPELKEPLTVKSEPKQGQAFLIKDSSLSPSTVSPDKIPTLVEDAKKIQGLMDERQRLLDDALGGAE